MCLYYFHTSDGYSQSSIYMRTDEVSTILPFRGIIYSSKFHFTADANGRKN